ncbi:Na+/H+ antiporter NhaA [Kineococcus radiotolerans SRS30216 = ATCC BAA-149]|uniref:Na(+)/H(+) antiporter NhaA 2 n=1 Tax=Kineococcus radiotolerans (strain ATCC BAA-149 / DSM 14245 / SRS30216) TaxID=266940 RepID=NHAA2_KINRD|nr:RecName: Full=Na(+)/H(+) antiporter NhaA 2; AltName: Full=Sodium/proton antiporter NhaA 2 [Kineococcus radiotolerans SRS30216 = ATCC BAA-149]ABS03590.1 Na+/H+ antiporter NhaA [Kineococcus radiotolerans SRS30216 = ATCC BAA-149]
MKSSTREQTPVTSPTPHDPTPPTPPRGSTPLFSRGSWLETRRITDVLRKETIGGALLLLGTVVALVWANSPWSSSYAGLRDTVIAPSLLHPLHLDLTLGQWAADGLLAIFFFIAGLELKREFVAGDLRDPRRALVPVAAAVGGMAVPAVVYVLVARSAGDGALNGWAIPTATDIAFAVAVLAVISTHLPTALRTFLLTLAVVDDLLAITIIAIFYTDTLAVLPLLGALAVIAVFGLLVQKRIRSWWLLIPLAVVAWALMHASGIHATVAGVLLGFTVPVLRSRAAGGPEAGPGMAEHFEHVWRPLSAGFAVPVFAFFSAGVTVGGLSGLVDSLQDRVALGIVAGLVVGKAAGILGATAAVSRFTRARLDPSLSWWDVLGASLLGGIGFTVSLLIGELAFGAGSVRDEHVKVGVLTGSLLAAALAAVVLRARNRVYRRLHEAERVDEDADGVPDVYQAPRLNG